MAIEKLPISIQTLYADLVERAWSGSMSELTGRGGSAYTRPAADGRRYLYWQPPTVAGRRPAAEYIGIDNETNRRRIAARQETAAARKERRDMVRSLRAARLPTPDKMTGEILAALAQAGAFRLRAAVVGSVAFMCYPGLLGMRIPASLARTGDLDIAQFHSVAIAVEDEIEDSFLSLLQRVDEGFTAIASPTDSRHTLRYALRKGEEEIYAVDVLCPLRGPERDRVTHLRALRSDAQALRFLDFLLYQEVNAVVLHGAGIPINLPAPERYALHKILISPMRISNPRSQAKARKDIDQAAALILALSELRPDDLADAWRELLERGASWREKAARGIRRLPAEPRQILADLVPERFSAELSG
jgi:hypothetical protein